MTMLEKGGQMTSHNGKGFIRIFTNTHGQELNFKEIRLM